MHHPSVGWLGLAIIHIVANSATMLLYIYYMVRYFTSIIDIKNFGQIFISTKQIPFLVQIYHWSHKQLFLWHLIQATKEDLIYPGITW